MAPWVFSLGGWDERNTGGAWVVNSVEKESRGGRGVMSGSPAGLQQASLMPLEPKLKKEFSHEDAGETVQEWKHILGA